jgi:hypothetical protein
VEHIELLKNSISPIVLISGVGLLLLSLTNRLGRVIDRSRKIVDELKTGSHKIHENKNKQLRILYKRAQILRTSITLTSLTILLSSVMILLLFLKFTIAVSIDTAFLIFFAVAISCLIAGVIFFLIDITLTLKALKYQIRKYR